MGRPAKVIRLPLREGMARPMPERLSPREVEQLLRWAQARGYTMEETSYATQFTRDWARSRDKEPRKRDWVRAIQTYMRSGWALRGIKKEQERRTGSTRSTPITDERIERAVLRAAEEGR